MTDQQEQHLDALRQFHATHGRAPTARECGAGWKPCKRPELPHYRTLADAFGSFSGAIRTAGLTPRPQGLRVDCEPALALLSHTTPAMILTSKDANYRAAEPPTHTTDALYCPANAKHSVRMEWERHNGVRTGRMIAWCYSCRAEVPSTARPLVFTAEELTESPKPRQVRQIAREVPENVRRLNAEIRLAWARGVKMHTLTCQYGITPQDVERVVMGNRKKRSA